MLSPAKRGADTVLHIGFGLSRPLRKGGWGQVRAMGYGTPATATPQDRDAIQLLQTLGAQTYGYSVSTIGSNFSAVVFKFQVSPELLWSGLKWALGIGLVGGLFPALRAARLPITTALRET